MRKLNKIPVGECDCGVGWGDGELKLLWCTGSGWRRGGLVVSASDFRQDFRKIGGSVV